MQQYNMLQAFFMSFYSKRLYRDVASNWGAKPFLYLFLLLTLSWIGLVVTIQRQLNLYYANYSDQIVVQTPILTISNGKIATPENRPYIITNPKTQERIGVIDTTGQYTSLEQAGGAFLITNTQIITQSDPHQIKTTELPNTLNMVVDPSTVNGYVKSYVGYAWIGLLIALVIFSYLYRIIQALIYGVIGKIFSSIVNAPLTYGQIIQLMLVAITPVIVLSTILDFFSVIFPHLFWIYFILALGYLFFAISANKLSTH